MVTILLLQSFNVYNIGRKVLVLEQHDDVCGGGTHMFDVKGYPFDSGTCD